MKKLPAKIRKIRIRPGIIRILTAKMISAIVIKSPNNQKDIFNSFHIIHKQISRIIRPIFELLLLKLVTDYSMVDLKKG